MCSIADGQQDGWAVVRINISTQKIPKNSKIPDALFFRLMKTVPKKSSENVATIADWKFLATILKLKEEQ